MGRAAGVGRARRQDRRAPGSAAPTGQAGGTSSSGAAWPRRPRPSRVSAVGWSPVRSHGRGPTGSAILVGGRRCERLGVELAGGQLLDVLGQLRDPALDDRLGEQGVGFGLEIGDLGLEFQPDDLALDLGIGRRERL